MISGGPADGAAYPHHREFVRTDIRMQLELRFEDGSEILAASHDISMNGVFALFETPPPIGSRCRVRIALAPPPGPSIEAQGEVARHAEGGFAIQFSAVDLDGYEHLRNLVRFNAENLGQVDEELEMHLGLRRR